MYEIYHPLWPDIDGGKASLSNICIELDLSEGVETKTARLGGAVD